MHKDTGMCFLLLIALSTWFRDGPLAGSWLAAAGLVFCCLVIFMSPLPSLSVALSKGLSGGSQTALSSGVAVNLSRSEPVQMNQATHPPFFPLNTCTWKPRLLINIPVCMKSACLQCPDPDSPFVPQQYFICVVASGVRWQDPSRKKSLKIITKCFFGTYHAMYTYECTSDGAEPSVCGFLSLGLNC